METVMSPLFIRLALGFGALLVILMTFFAIFMIMRRELFPKKEEGGRRASLDAAFMMAGYDDVLRKVKDQEKEMDRIRRTERDQAATASSLTDSVLASIKAGMVHFNKMGLVRLADPLARTILGYASPTGMRARDIFRALPSPEGLTSGTSGPDMQQQIVMAIESSAKEGKEGCTLSTLYKTPSGEERKILVGIFPFKGDTPETQGAGCVVMEVHSNSY